MCFGIPIRSKKEGNYILNAINTEDFKEIIKATKWGAFQTQWEMFKYFKPDFYKQFLGKSSKLTAKDVYGSDPRFEGMPDPVAEDIEPEPAPEYSDTPLVLSQSKSKAKSKSGPKKINKTIKKNKCSKAHPPGPCDPGMYPKPPTDCCYKETKKNKNTKKSKNSGGGRRVIRTRKRTRKRSMKRSRKRLRKRSNRRNHRTNFKR